MGLLSNCQEYVTNKVGLGQAINKLTFYTLFMSERRISNIDPELRREISRINIDNRKGKVPIIPHQTQAEVGWVHIGGKTQTLSEFVAGYQARYDEYHRQEKVRRGSVRRRVFNILRHGRQPSNT